MPFGNLDFASARKAKLSHFVQGGVKKFRYTYDMGDNWEHVIQVEKTPTHSGSDSGRLWR
jgi:hypothetical protein